MREHILKITGMIDGIIASVYRDYKDEIAFLILLLASMWILERADMALIGVLTYCFIAGQINMARAEVQHHPREVSRTSEIEGDQHEEGP